MSEASIEYQRRQLARRDPRPAPNPSGGSLPIGDIYGPYADGGEGEDRSIVPEPERELQKDTSDSDLQKQADDAAMARQTQQQDYENSQRELERQDKAREVTAVVNATFTEYGLGSLIPLITQYAQQGYGAEAISVLLRSTQEYKQRFPAMSALASKGRAISEGAYIAYERTASSLERQYGLPQGMLTGSVTNMLTNEVSMEELNDRVVLASSASINAPESLKQTFRNFYGVDALTAYFLDPTIATPLLQKQVATAEIGEAAMRQNIGLGLDMATQLQELGITREGAMTGFQQVGRTESLQSGRGDKVTQPQAIEGVFGTNQESAKALERAQLARSGRFQGGGGFVSEREGTTGLSSSSR